MMTRSQFLRAFVGLGAAAVGTSVLVGCTSEGSPGPGPDAGPSTNPDATPSTSGDAPTQGTPDAPPASCSGAATITANHGHAISVAAADIAAGVDKTYNIKGGSAHPHTVTITAAMFAMLQASQAITVRSSSDAGHTHDVTVSCA